ncbi:GNAT family N-acetyltransferase [Natronorubrum halophilum]|uniref:GNAT family N-acetyltransferase n=1 Tax=Natronorubrum halophilum TaxID=1702106 RepID=UPI001EE813E2|nr:GNAT family protein [Natronorubrum halophilum]
MTGKPAIWLRKQFCGRGYSAERARDGRLAFERLSLDLVAVPVEDGNEKSRRAVETYVETNGGQYDGIIRNSTVRLGGDVVDHHRYTISREQYQGGQ